MLTVSCYLGSILYVSLMLLWEQGSLLTLFTVQFLKNTKMNQTPVGKVCRKQQHKGILCYTVVYCGVLWYTVVYCGILWYTVVYHSIPQYTTVYHSIPQYTTVYHSILQYIQASLQLQENNVRRSLGMRLPYTAIHKQTYDFRWTC